jgi:hypothetical protein
MNYGRAAGRKLRWVLLTKAIAAACTRKETLEPKSPTQHTTIKRFHEKCAGAGRSTGPGGRVARIRVGDKKKPEPRPRLSVQSLKVTG